MGNSINEMKKKLIIATILSIPLVVMSDLFASAFNVDLSFPGDNVVQIILASIEYFYCGNFFLKHAYHEIKSNNIGMMTLVSLAITTAYFYSTITIILGRNSMNLYWELSTLIVIMLLGHILEYNAVTKASNAFDSLAKLIPKSTHLILDNGKIEDVKIDKINVNDKVLVKAYERIPFDGEVLKGTATVDESMLTGESEGVVKKVSDNVTGGSINGSQEIVIQVKHIGEDTYLSQVINLVEDSKKKKSKIEKLTDKLARYLTFIAISVSLITLISWLFLGQNTDFAVERAITVIVIACPHALGLAVPLIVANSTAISSTNGLLIKDRQQFDMARKINVIFFDKTGTLTVGNPQVSQIICIDQKYTNQDILDFAYSMEKTSIHPLANGIIKKWKEEGKSEYNISSIETVVGVGLKGNYNNKNIEISNVKALDESQKKLIPSNLEGTIAVLLIEKEVIGCITLDDELRSNAYNVIDELQNMGIKVYMATGDSKENAQRFAKKLNLDGFYAQTLPEQKLDIIQSFIDEGKCVAMTGDGVNDAPALALADVSIVIGSGTDVAIDTGGIVLINNKLHDIVKLIQYSKTTYVKMIQNIIWATGYNFIAIILATGIFYPFLLPPSVGAIFMTLSTIIVAINAQLLTKKLKKIK